MSGSNGTNHLGVNLSFTKFLFVSPQKSDETTLARIKGVAAMVARGYFNDFEGDGSREAPTQDTLQFLTSTCPADGVLRPGHIRGADLVEISSPAAGNRGRVQEALCGRCRSDGARWCAARTALHQRRVARLRLQDACPRASGRQTQTVIIIPMRKTPEWWSKSTLERHMYLYPHMDPETLETVPGHAQVAEAGISTIFRRLYYNPDGHSRDGEFDFITYFECADAHLPVFDEVCRGLRDVTKNPEWRFVIEGQEWRGRRVLRW